MALREYMENSIEDSFSKGRDKALTWFRKQLISGTV